MFKYTNSNVYKILDVLRKQETLTGNKFEREKKKKQTTKRFENSAIKKRL
jgi:hypothetical protein